MSESVVISITRSNGVSIPCEILDIFEYADRQYALLKDLRNECLVIMNLVSSETESTFRAIESDEEYESVVSHIQFLAKQNSDEDSE